VEAKQRPPPTIHSFWRALSIKPLLFNLAVSLEVLSQEPSQFILPTKFLKLLLKSFHSLPKNYFFQQARQESKSLKEFALPPFFSSRNIFGIVIKNNT